MVFRLKRARSVPRLSVAPKISVGELAALPRTSNWIYFQGPPKKDAREEAKEKEMDMLGA